MRTRTVCGGDTAIAAGLAERVAREQTVGQLLAIVATQRSDTDATKRPELDSRP